MPVFRIISALVTAVFLAVSLSHCGTTLIKDQKTDDMSAVTMYMAVNRNIIEGVAIKNLTTGEVFYNKQYGWGKEYFPDQKRLSFLSIGNIGRGTYCLHKVVFWYFPPGETRKKNIELLVPDDTFRFVVSPGDILYLGDIHFTIFAPQADAAAVDTMAQDLRNRKFAVKSFKAVLPVVNTENRVLYINGVEPTSAPGLRQGEESFLRFFISKGSSVSGWAAIARKKLNDAGNHERERILKNLESQ